MRGRLVTLDGTFHAEAEHICELRAKIHELYVRRLIELFPHTGIDVGLAMDKVFERLEILNAKGNGYEVYCNRH
jgi:hypothetical protein